MPDKTFRFEHEDDILEITIHEDGDTGVMTNFPQSEDDFDEEAPEEDMAYTIGYLRGVQNILTALAEQGVDLSGGPFQEAFAIAVDNLVEDEEEEEEE
jgi:hypothetical protein